MDQLTIERYNHSAAAVAELHTRLRPERLYQLAQRFFHPARACLDLGCGIGRDSAWLATQGYPVLGVDAAHGMLQQARQRYPQLAFQQDSLPALATIPDASYHNLWCVAVLMHLDAPSQAHAIEQCARVLVAGGVLLLSWRGTDAPNQREDGKLYSHIDSESLLAAAAHLGLMPLHSETNLEAGRGLQWWTVVLRKQGAIASAGYSCKDDT